MPSAADVRELVLRFGAETEIARRNIRDLSGDLDRNTSKMENDLDRLDKKADKVGAAFGRMKGVVAGALGGIVSVAAAKSLLEFADDLEAAAERAGTGIERYQTLTRALRVLEVDADSVDKMFMKLQATLGDVQNGADNSAVQALDRLGVKARILTGEIDSTDELLDAIANSSRNAGTQAQFAAEMADVFGARLSGKLVPALADGGARLREFEGAARDSGILTEEMAGELSRANEQIEAFGEKIKYKAAMGLAGLIPHLERAIEWFDKLGQAARDAGASVADALGDARAAQTLREGADSVDRSDAEQQLRFYGAISRFPMSPASRQLLDDYSWGARRQLETDFGRNPGIQDTILSIGRGAAAAERRVAPTRRIAERTSSSSGTRGSGSSGPVQLLRDPDDILRSLGTHHTPNGGHRSLAQNRQVGGAQRSYHLRDQARDIPLMRGNHRENRLRIEQAFRAAGYDIAESLGPDNEPRGHDDHYHIAWRNQMRGGRGVGRAGSSGSSGEGSVQRLADEAARNAQRLIETQQRNAEAMERELESANDRILAARQQTAESAAERARFELMQVAAERQQADADALRDYNERASEDPANQGRYALQLALLGMANKEVADLQAAAVNRAEARRVEEERLELRTTALDDEQALLQLQGSLATSTDERARIGHRLLDLALEQERIQLEALAADTQASDASREIARRRLAMLGEVGALRREGLNRQNEGPRDRYMRELRDSLGNIDNELEGLAVDAMRDLSEESARALTQVLGLEGALGNLADRLLSMAFDQGISALLEMAFGGGKSGGSGIGSSIANGFINLFGGKREMGGPVQAGMAYIVGEKRPELFVPRVPGVIIPRVPGQSASGGITINQHFAPNFAGNAVTKDDLFMMGRIAKAETLRAVQDARRRAA